MQHPFQRLCSLEDNQISKLLLLATGASLFLFDISQKVVVSQWPQTVKNPPVEDLSTKIETKPLKKPGNIIVLEISPDGEHVVTISAEDKCLRVFNIGKDHSLTLESERFMPKRPVAVAFPADKRFLIIGDKFGDIYALPFHPSDDDAPEEAPSVSLRPYKPAANEKTVHTARNLKVLEAQLKTNRTVTEKTGPAFKHTVLLGHVSMLTDVKCAYVHPDHKETIGVLDRPERSYIISADRDEHIRVSRGIPQSHIIEGYCLGHRDFISRLCLLKMYPHMLVSGGGDVELFVWDWFDQKLLQRVPLESLVSDHIQIESTPDISQVTSERLQEYRTGPPNTTVIRRIPPIAGIYSSTSAINDNEQRSNVFVTFEALPIVLIFSASLNGLEHIQTIVCDGNVLDITTFAEDLLLSLDNIHGPGTTQIEPWNTAPQIEHYVFRDGDWIPEDNPVIFEDLLNSSNSVKVDEDGVTELLYGLESLRKRGP